MNSSKSESSIIDEKIIFDTLQQNHSYTNDKSKTHEILHKSLEYKGLSFDDVAYLMKITDIDLHEEIFATAKKVKEQIYGNRLVLFAPLYSSNFCSNECVYCAFRASNQELSRRSLSQNEIAQEVMTLLHQGHKRILLVAGEQPNQLPDVLDTIDTIYKTKTEKSEIRRVNVNVAPLTIDEFRQLKAHQIGTYQLFQETYHSETYQKVHRAGIKKDYHWRISVMDRAMEAGIDDVGIGALFGLYDWQFELLALMQHAEHLSQKFGVGPHTISVPRIEPACGSDFSNQPPYAVSDLDFCRIIAILRLAVPYTGIILSTREDASIRRQSFALGVSQISAGSRTNPGGYQEKMDMHSSQFSLGDQRSLEEVIFDVCQHGYIPSFCTACYRKGRTGLDFMELAKPGDIKKKCAPNALVTFMEYLLDFASEETQQIGFELIETELSKMAPRQKMMTEKMIDQIKAGQHDIFI